MLILYVGIYIRSTPVLASAGGGEARGGISWHIITLVGTYYNNITS